MFLVELFVQGVIQGSVYALIAVGLTLVYGLLRILHVAHAGLFTLGGYAGVLITNATGSAALALLAAALLVGAAGMRSEEHTSELQSLMRISYAVFCLKQKKNTHIQSNN